MAKELVWNERNLKKFWDYWSGKEDAYFAIAFGHIIATESNGFKSVRYFSTDLNSNFNYSKRNFIKYKLRSIKSKVLNHKLYKPLFFGIFKKI